MVERTLKPGWKVWRFGQMAENIGERADPTPDDSELYVGLEHMDTDSLRIRRWGSKTDLIGQKLKMRKGDILFARRNAYLKRVAIAPHDGRFSAHGMVLRAKPEVVLPEFLPFFMQSDLFMDRAIEISVGSLSPTINWKTMAIQEFALPPMEMQRRVTEALIAIEEEISALEALDCSSNRLLRSLMIEHFDADYPELVSVANVGTWHSGGTPARGNASYWGGAIPWISPKDMKTSELDTAEEKLTEAGAGSGLKLMPINTIMIVVRGMILAHTFPVARTLVPATFNQDMKALVVGSEFRPKYIQYWFQHASPRYLQLVSASSHGTKRLESDKLFSLSVPKIGLEAQDEFIKQIDAVRDSARKAMERQNKALDIKRRFLNEKLKT